MFTKGTRLFVTALLVIAPNHKPPERKPTNSRTCKQLWNIHPHPVEYRTAVTMNQVSTCTDRKESVLYASIPITCKTKTVVV